MEHASCLRDLIISLFLLVTFVPPLLAQEQTPLKQDNLWRRVDGSENIHNFSQSDPDVILNIWTKNGTRNSTAPYLSGLFFEDIAHSGDGGLYAELIRNRAFQGSGVTIGSAEPLLPGVIITESENPIIPFAPTLDGWYAIGDGVRLSLDVLHPLSNALQVALQVDVPLNATGEVGFKNDGWWGIPVSPQTYNSTFHCQTNGFRWNDTLTHFNVSLRDNATGEVFVTNSIPLSKPNAPVPWMYQEYSAQLHSTTAAPTINNSFAITMDAAEARGQTFYFNLISLFPETYKNRPNGLRKDLAEPLAAGGFRFLRFPGGNNLEGYSIARRWKWWETIGPLKDRPGRPGDWTYFNTDGLGLLEYMYWCEDMDLVPVLGVYAGFSLDIANYDSSNSTDANELPVSLMGPILQEALDELEFLMGDTSTPWGRKRAEYGHPEPFDVPFVEVGNEDFFSHNYPARAAFMLKGLREKYPDITYVYSSASTENFNLTLPKGTIWDKHIYDSARVFIDNFNEFDNWQTQPGNEGVYASIMEYHVNHIDDPFLHPVHNLSSTSTNGTPEGAIGARTDDRRMLSAVAEAVTALGWERNPNTVKLACFAPLLQNAHVWRHTPYLLLFTALPNSTLCSPSYHAQRLFNLHHGTHTLPVTASRGGFGPLYWQAAFDEGRGAVYLKVVNAGVSGQRLEVRGDGGCGGWNGTGLWAGGAEGEGEIFLGEIVGLAVENGRVEEEDANGPARWFQWDVPARSVNVIQFDLE